MGSENTVLFLDAENMGNAETANAIRYICKKYNPSSKIIVMAARNVSNALKQVIDGFQIFYCNPGKNAADYAIQKRMMQTAADKNVDRVILFTNDHGFAAACNAIINAGKKLLIAFSKAKRLIRAVGGKTNGLFSILNVNSFKDKPKTKKRTSIFFKKSDGEVCEIPFVSGMLLRDLVAVLKQKNAYRKHITRHLKENFLSLVNDRFVYIDVDGILA